MSGKPDSFMPLYWGDYLADTGHLTASEHGAYLLLIGHYWRTAAPLADDDARLRRITKMTAPEWKLSRATIRAFFIAKDGLLCHERVEGELQKAAAKYAKRKAASDKGNAIRWGSENKSQCDPNGNELGIPIVSQPQPQPQPPEKNGKKVGMHKFFSGNGNGAGNGQTTIKDEGERLARFQNWLASGFAKTGTDLKEAWTIIGAANDPENADYARCVAICKTKAQELGKGWPRQWPHA